MMAEASEGISSDSTSTETSDNISLDDVELSREGIILLMNNEWAEADELFKKHREYSPLMYAGSSFVTFMQALMTFEDEKLASALKCLQELEKKCELNEGFIRNLKRKITKTKKQDEISLEDRLQRKIIVADAILYQALLAFINQDLSGYVKGGWLLRKAYKIYDKLYKDIRTLYNKKLKEDSKDSQNDLSKLAEGDSCTDPQESLIKSTASDGSGDPRTGADKTASVVSQADSDQHSSTTEQSTTLLPLHVIERLKGSVCFGYGSFQLCISMVPPKILKIIEFLGFEGDREVGLKALDYASHSKDMKAPLATMSLLWYHTVIRPFFALDGITVDAGVEEAVEIVNRCEKEYPKSALYLFFKGRVQRLQCRIDEALSTYAVALEQCSKQREVQLICVYEIGWLNMMTLNWQESLKCFTRLQQDSKWSKCYYGYLSAVCHGASGDQKAAVSLLKKVPSLLKRKNNQIEAFVSRRAEKFLKQGTSRDIFVLLGLEVLYLWNAVPQCRKEDIQLMLEECGKQTDKKLFHLSSLIEGALYRELGDEEFSLQCFKEAAARQQGMKDDFHVATFAMYEMGSMLSEKPETFERGRKYLLQVKDHFSDYDFENRLNVRIQACLRRMKTQGTPV